MGLNLLFSSSSSDKKVSGSLLNLSSDSRIDNKVTVIESKSLPNPQPNNYKILRHLTFNNCLIIEIQYLDCTNYEGRKILVFKCTLEDLTDQKLIDPHFSENKNFISPIARFEPTEYGWSLARQLVQNIY